MSFSILDMLDMVPLSPARDSDSTPSRAASPAPPLHTPHSTQHIQSQTSPLLHLPSDIFSCLLDYLDRDAAWSLKRLCSGMAASKAVNQLLFHYPLQQQDVAELRLCDWLYRRRGQQRWLNFQQAINDDNRHYVHRLALSHWASLDDFRWIEKSLPSLAHLDLSAIKDFVWSPECTWTWHELAQACPGLFARLTALDVANWADYTAHSRIEYSYGYSDYRFKQTFRKTRRHDGGSIAQELFPICTQLQLLSIRERHSGFHTWNEWEVHQRVCSLVDGIEKHCPPTLTRLRVHDYAPYRSLFATDLSTWSSITHVEIGLYSWMEDRCEREPMGPVPYRIAAGDHHRQEEEAFSDKTFASCTRDHMGLGNHVVQSVGASFEDLLQSLHAMSLKYPAITFRPINAVDKIIIHPFHLVNVMQRRRPFGQPLGAPAGPTPPVQNDPISRPEIQEAIGWLQSKCDWKPHLAWDSMMCDVFPANLEGTHTFLPKLDALSRITHMITTLRDLNLPVRVSIGERTNLCPSSGVDGSLYFGDYKTFDDSQTELLLPTQAVFNLAPIAHMIDELSIQYPVDVPSVGSWPRLGRRPTPAELDLMSREKTGWRRFWARYACSFKNLKKLSTNVPADIYADWAHSKLPDLLAHPSWQLLNVADRPAGSDADVFACYFPFSAARFPTPARKKVQRVWVQRVFFREDDKPLELSGGLGTEEGVVTAEMIRDRVGGAGRFWDGVAKRGWVEEGERDGKRARLD